MKVYLIGSLRNPEIPDHAKAIRELGFDVFDDWFAAGPEADDYWKKYEEARGNSYEQALKGYAAKHVFSFDKHHIDEADIGILILPAGRSGHLELGYMAGQGAATYILHDDPERWDCMYQFADGVFFKKEDLLAELQQLAAQPAEREPEAEHDRGEHVRLIPQTCAKCFLEAR